MSSTSSVTFNISQTGSGMTIAVNLVDGDETVNRIITRANPSFDRLSAYLLSTDEHDVDTVRLLVDPAVAIGRSLQAEFGGRVTFDLHHFYLDGVREDSVLADHIKDRVLSGDTDWHRLVRFLVRLDANPSKRAKDAVWGWVEKHGVTIAQDGRMIGYKGLVEGVDALTGETCPVSYHSGPNNFIDGVLYGETGESYQVPHRLGTVISKRRADVDDNGSLACSTGLHVGAYSYAKTFGENRADGARYSTMGRMADTLPNSTFALVAFGPEAVVSVPEDGTADWKIRVHEYEVTEFLEVVEDVLKDKPVYDVKTPAPFIPAGEPKPERVDNRDLVEAEDPVEEEVEETTQEPSGDLTLAENAALVPDLAKDLADPSIGHKPLARKWSHLTTEASVRRYRKAQGISLSLGSRVRDALG